MTVDLSTVPLVALSVETKHVISTLLNPPKVIPCENGLPRDWRGLAHLSELSGEIMPLLTSHPDPSAHILTVWYDRQKNITIRNFQAVLEKLDRWDILDDTSRLLENDAETYMTCLQKSQTSAKVTENEIDAKILTVDDVHRLRQGLQNQYYDAFLLYADEDINFASEMIDKLENQFNLKLCLKDRDLIGGVTFEHEAVMTLISERCNRLIVIVSSNFLKSPANQFFLNYAQALGIDKRQRKIVPCLYEKCQLPPQLSYMFILDYNRVGLYDFWGKLRDSVQTSSSVKLDVKRLSNEEENASLSEKEKDVKLSNGLEIYKDSHWECSKTLNIQEQEPISKPDNNKNSQFAPGNLHNPNDNDKKHNNFLQWTKRKLNRKADNNKKDYEQFTGTVTIPSLPSLEDLDSLSTSTDSVDKKLKPKFIDKYVKKVQLRKVLVKS